MVKPNLQQYAQLAAVIAVVVGCYLIFAPFIPAILFAAVACSSSWPLYLRVRRWVRGRRSVAAMLMSILWVIVVIGPSILLADSLANSVGGVVEPLRGLLEGGPPKPPAWLKDIPLVGSAVDGYWQRLTSSRQELLELSKNLIDPLRRLVLGAGKAIGASLLQLVLATFVGFFFYRDGERLIEIARRILARLAGEHGEEMLATIDNTIAGVVNGVFGTALVQALVAAIGFLIAGVPAVLLLATATFFLSIVPVGPPLIWIGAALWLYLQDQLGWAIFMALWGLLAISSVDNVVKPILISRSSSLPMLLIVIGVFGGIYAFGFIGTFIGPPMLAVGLGLVMLWIGSPAQQPAADSTASPASDRPTPP